MPEPTTTLGIDEYLRDRLMPMDEEISQIEGIEFFADSIPVTGGLIAGMQEKDSAERDRCRNTPFSYVAGLSLATSLLLVGCSHAPEYSIFGSFFPVWIFCSIGGLLLMAVFRTLIARTVIAKHLAAPVLLYLSMAIFLSCVLWLLLCR